MLHGEHFLLAEIVFPLRPRPMVCHGVITLQLLVVLQRLRVDAVRQHPALVVVRAQTELALLVRVHCAVPHSEAPVGYHVPIARKGSLETLGTHLVLPLVDSLGRNLRLAGGLVLYVVALAAKCDCVGSLLLELE